jgi:lysophospholipase L1-like esterase
LRSYSSRWILQVLPQILQSAGSEARAPDGLAKTSDKALFITLMLGANDAAGCSLPGVSSNTSQHISLTEYTENMRAILEHCCAVSHAVVLMTPPPVDTTKWPDRATDAVRPYCDAVKTLAAESVRAGQPVVLVDFFEGMLALGEDLPLAFCDGLHLSDLGNKMLHDRILQALECQGFGFLLPDALGIDFPLKEAIDNTSISATALSLSKEVLEKLHSSPQKL